MKNDGLRVMFGHVVQPGDGSDIEGSGQRAEKGVGRGNRGHCEGEGRLDMGRERAEVAGSWL